METQPNHLSFDDAKNLFKEAANDSSTASELYEIFIQKIYQKGRINEIKKNQNNA